MVFFFFLISPMTFHLDENLMNTSEAPGPPLCARTSKNLQSPLWPPVCVMPTFWW